jgi:hypothetical protein
MESDDDFGSGQSSVEEAMEDMDSGFSEQEDGTLPT